ncbi:MAG: hypothetical protein WCS97_03630 [Candidatus Paceibacterota bacterium]|jgi:hypothetical protein
MSEGLPKVGIEHICREIDEINDERLLSGLTFSNIGEYSDFDSYLIEGEVGGHSIRVLYSEDENEVTGTIDEVPLTKDYTKKFLNRYIEVAKSKEKLPPGVYPVD